MSVKLLEVSADDAGQRLDNFLLRELKGAPRTLIYRIVRKGEVRVNKKRAKPLQKLMSGDIVRVPPVRLDERQAPPKPSSSLEQLLRQAVLFDDDAILAINKPAGLAVHGGSGINLGMVESLRQIFPEYRHLELVHRLDRDTSGVILLAKKRSALRALHAGLREKHIQKIYHCLVYGAWPARQKNVNAPLKKNVLQSGERMVSVDQEEGKKSLTRFNVLAKGGGYSYVEASPITGRTHQIRVHCQYAGHPIVGDDKYATKDQLKTTQDQGVKRLCLHARKISFDHPISGERIELEAPLDAAFEAALEQLLS